MSPHKLEVAISEARRFLGRALLLQMADEKHRAWEKQNPDKPSYENPIIDPFYGSKESGAVRRSSMDLTRALAELRKY